MARMRWILLLFALITLLSVSVLVLDFSQVLKQAAIMAIIVSALAIGVLAIFSKEFADAKADDNYWQALALIPFAKAILTAVPAKTETAILTLIEHCHAIKDKRGFENKLVQQANPEMPGNGNAGSLAAIVRAIGKSFASEQAEILKVGEAQRQTIERLRAMELELSDSVELLCGIREITDQSTAITLKMADSNANPGAADPHCHGMIQELRELNQHSARYSEKAGKMLELLLSFNRENINVIISEGDREYRRIDASLRVIAGLLDQLGQLAGETIQEITTVSRQAKEIDDDAQALLESLQFQDITRQMVEGAVDILNEISAHLLACARETETGDKNHREILAIFQEKIRQTLSDRSKTADEKNAIAGVVK